jgi:hypothetical protein
MLRTVVATRYVTPLREGGSLPGLVEADDDGMYVLKFRGAGQGPKALIAELVVGEIGRRLGLPVPEIVFVELDPSLGKAEPDYEIRRLIEDSGGINVGLDFLPGALSFNPVADAPPPPDRCAEIVWFDALMTNPDRTARNTNILVWHGRPWLIDHGAALYVHHTWLQPMEHARRTFDWLPHHVLLPFAGSIAAADERLTPILTVPAVEEIVRLVPDEWLAADAHAGAPADLRAAYVNYLARRLEAPRPFVEDADRARAA